LFYQRNIFTFLRTIFCSFNPRWIRICQKRFLAYFTNYLSHFSSKIKAAFGGLKEVVRPLHLLTAKFLDTKIPQLSSILSIALLLTLSTFSYADEQITSYDESTIPVLNEELRRLNAQLNKVINGNGSTTDTANTKYIYFVLPDDNLTTGTDKLGRIYMPFAGTISEAHASVKTAPTGADIVVDLNLNGSTIWSTQTNRVTIAASANIGTQTTFNTASFASGDYFTIDLDTVGSSVAGAKLVVRLKVVKT